MIPQDFCSLPLSLFHFDTLLASLFVSADNTERRDENFNCPKSAKADKTITSLALCRLSHVTRLTMLSGFFLALILSKDFRNVSTTHNVRSLSAVKLHWSVRVGKGIEKTFEGKLRLNGFVRSSLREREREPKGALKPNTN